MRRADDLEDLEHILNKLGNLEAFLRVQLSILEEKKNQLEVLRKPLS